MRILLIRSHNPFFESTASGNRYAGIIDGLSKHNVRVTLLITGGYNNMREYKLRGKLAHNDNITVNYIIPTINNNIWFRRVNKYILSGLFQFIINYKLKNIFQLDYDFLWLTFDAKVFHSYCNHYSLIKKKTIIELNEFNDLHEYNEQPGNLLQQYKVAKENQAFLAALKKIDLLVVMTKTLIKHYSAFSKPDAKFLHMPMTVDLARFSNLQSTINDPEKPYIAYIGTFSNLKDGIDILIHAFSKIASKYEKYSLHLAGFYYHDIPDQLKLINNYNLSDRIIYWGLLDKNLVPEFLQKAELLVMARPDSRQAKGGFPTKLGEYLATGKPVCVTKVGEIPEYLEDNESAFMAEPGNAESFADAMDRALSNYDNARRVGLNGLRIAQKHFNIDIQSKRLIEFLEVNL